MSSFFMSLACGLFAFCVLGADTPSAVTNKVPKLVLLGTGIDQALGKIKSYETQSVCFRFKNNGNVPAEIRNLISTCACISGSVDKKLIQPQEEAVITVVLDPATVTGGFKRVLWVDTNDPAWPRIGLTVSGEVFPLFAGLPKAGPQPIILEEGVTWTNRFTFTQTETNLFLGAPLIATDTNTLRAVATLVTNNQKKTSFDVTLLVTPLATGRHPLTLSIPVEGYSNMPPVTLVYSMRVGLALKVVPSKILLSPSDQPLTRRLNIALSEGFARLSAESLTWAPQREGVSVKVQKNPRTSSLSVTLTLSPEAIAKLRQEKDAQLTFTYPNYKPIHVSFVSQIAPAAGEGSANPGQ